MPKILLIEDNEMNRDMLARRLGKRGFEVVVAVDGREGLSLAESEQPELILMDMSLPVLEGWEAARELKRSAATRNIPVIALTAHAMSGDREKALAAGCNDFDTKPVDLSRLLEKIQVLLDARVASPGGGDAVQLRHDLRTPLNHLIGYSEMLLEEVDLPELRTVLREGKTLLDVVDEVLSGPASDGGPLDLDSLGARLDVHLRTVTAAAAAVRPRVPEDLRDDVDRIAAAVQQLARLVGGEPAAAVVAFGVDHVSDAPAGATILVVDDNEENRNLLVRRLEREGYAVQVAEGGLRALELLETCAADLVLLDVMMPDLDGVEVLQRIKGDPRHRELPVLMISALDEIETVVRSIELGAEDYLSKPFNAVLLRARIGACLDKKSLRDQERLHQKQMEEWNRTLQERVERQVSELENLTRLKRFFSPQLAERILVGGADDPLRTHRREITVVFLDLRGFTAFAETSEPEEVMRVLREYHEQMGQLILAHEGTLERFTGDGLMVFFNDPMEVPNPAERAVRMALAMRERVQALEVAWRRRGYNLALGVGITRGYATVGAIGFEGRWDYAAIGTVTNMAARLCGEAAGGQILISSPVAASVEDFAEIEPIGGLTLKGLARPIEVYSVVGLRS